MKSSIYAVFLLLLSTLCWSMSGVIIKSVAISPFAITALGAAIGAFTQLLYLRTFKITFSFITLSAAFLYSGVTVCSIVATRYTSAANAVLLQFSSPVFAALLNTFLLKQPPAKDDIIAMSIVLPGMGLFFIDALSFDNILGNAIAILSAIFIAGYSYTLKLNYEGRQLETALYGNIFLTIACAPALIETTVTFSDLWKISLLGIFGFGLGWIYYCTAIKQVTSVQALIITTPEAILNPLLVLAVVGEMPGTWSIVGGLIILIVVSWYSYKSATIETEAT